MSPDADSVVVTGIGMRTPLGEHAAQSCASVRAGLQRFTQWRHYNGRRARITASAVKPDLFDRPWVDKAPDLLRPPLAEALWSAEVYDLAEAQRAARPLRARVFLCTPYPDRAGVDPPRYDAFAATIGRDVFGSAALPLELVSLEHVAGPLAFARVCEALQNDEADLCLVGGVDSLLENEFLGWLEGLGRLKDAAHSSGIIPGEGAAFVVLERAETALRRGAQALARVEAIALERDEPWAPEAPVRGDGLTRAIRAVFGAAGEPAQFSRVLCDLNGERWRFLEWALVETRCLGSLPREWKLWHPADCLGDVGAAYGPIAVCLAVRALQRGYAGRGKILITSMAERGERAALALSRPEVRNGGNGHRQ